MSISLITPSSKKFAVIIGSNYIGTPYQLNGCIADATAIKQRLISKCGYQSSNMIMMTDDGAVGSVRPTKAAIQNVFNTIVSKAVTEQFTEFWFSYSGHGSTVTDTNGDEADRLDEVICPVDFATAGMIIDDYIYDNLVAKLPLGTTLVAMMDCCHSGTIFDLPFIYKTSFVTNNTNGRHVCTAVSISGCRDDQTSADAYINKSYQGAMTWSLLKALENANYNISLVNLTNAMRTLLAGGSYAQVPLLAVSSSTTYNSLLMAGPIDPIVSPVVPIVPVVPVSPVVPVVPVVPIVPIVPITKNVTFNMTTDNWFRESSWNIWSAATNTYVFPTDNIFTSKNQIVTINKNLSNGSYKLIVKDTYGDGGVRSKVYVGSTVLIYAKMYSGKLAEYAFTI